MQRDSLYKTCKMAFPSTTSSAIDRASQDPKSRASEPSFDPLFHETDGLCPVICPGYWWLLLSICFWCIRLLKLRRRPITTEAIGSAATHPSLRGALATKQSRGHNMRGASNPDRRTAAPGLLRFARNDGQGIGSLVSACRLILSADAMAL